MKGAPDCRTPHCSPDMSGAPGDRRPGRQAERRGTANTITWCELQEVQQARRQTGRVFKEAGRLHFALVHVFLMRLRRLVQHAHPSTAED